MKTKEPVGDEIRYVGIRGHFIYPVWEKTEENTMEIAIAGYMETPFEKQYLFRNACAPGSSRIWWMQKKDNFEDGGQEKLPPYMVFPKEALMLLR